MDSRKPVKIKVEYDDDTIQEFEIKNLSYEVQKDLAKLGIITCLAHEQKHILVEWKNGWKEVFAVPVDVTTVRNYYVIRRVEETGRLFLNRENGYPELLEILRKPRDVEKVTLI